MISFFNLTVSNSVKFYFNGLKYNMLPITSTGRYDESVKRLRIKSRGKVALHIAFFFQVVLLGNGASFLFIFATKTDLSRPYP